MIVKCPDFPAPQPALIFGNILHNSPLPTSQMQISFLQMPSSHLVVYVNLFILRDSAMASITERAQRMEKDLRETAAKHDRAAAELQVSLVH